MTHEEKLIKSLEWQFEIEPTERNINYLIENAKRISEEYEMDIESVIDAMCFLIEGMIVMNKQHIIFLLESIVKALDAGRANPVKTKSIKRERK